MTMTKADHAAAHAAKAITKVAVIECELQSLIDRKKRAERRLIWWRAKLDVALIEVELEKG